MPSSPHEFDRRTKRRRLALVFAVCLVLLCAGAILAFRGLGRWLVREDPLSPSDVIVVLSGSMPFRAEEAANIYKLGLAPSVWVTHPAGPEDELTQLGIRYTGEDEYNVEVLERDGVPPTSIHVIPDSIVDTEQEIREIARDLRADGKTSVIIVTSPQHTRRVRTLWRKLAGGLRAQVRAAREDPFDADHWWRDTTSALSVAREALGLMNAWAGLPVRPRPLSN